MRSIDWQRNAIKTQPNYTEENLKIKHFRHISFAWVMSHRSALNFTAETNKCVMRNDCMLIADHSRNKYQLHNFIYCCVLCVLRRRRAATIISFTIEDKTFPCFTWIYCIKNGSDRWNSGGDVGRNFFFIVFAFVASSLLSLLSFGFVHRYWLHDDKRTNRWPKKKTRQRKPAAFIRCPIANECLCIFAGKRKQRSFHIIQSINLSHYQNEWRQFSAIWCCAVGANRRRNGNGTRYTDQRRHLIEHKMQLILMHFT